MGAFHAKQNEVAKDVTTTEAEIRTAVLDQRQKLKEGAITKKTNKKSRMRVQVASPSKKEYPQAKEPVTEEGAAKSKEDAADAEDEGETGGLLGLGDYGSDDDE